MKKKEEKERARSGLDKSQAKILKKNASILKKKLNDSKTKKIKFTKSSQFFQNMQKAQSG